MASLSDCITDVHWRIIHSSLSVKASNIYLRICIPYCDSCSSTRNVNCSDMVTQIQCTVFRCKFRNDIYVNHICKSSLSNTFFLTEIRSPSVNGLNVLKWNIALTSFWKKIFWIYIKFTLFIGLLSFSRRSWFDTTWSTSEIRFEFFNLRLKTQSKFCFLRAAFSRH